MNGQAFEKVIENAPRSFHTWHIFYENYKIVYAGLAKAGIMVSTGLLSESNCVLRNSSENDS